MKVEGLGGEGGEGGTDKLEAESMFSPDRD